VSVLDGWRMCPRCGAGLGREAGHVSCRACGFVFYANPAPTASALCLDDDRRLLLARRAHEPFRGRWDTPGGFVEEDEHPLDALRRELREETGLEIEPLEFFGVWMDRYGAGDDDRVTLNLFWTVRAVGGEERPDDDVAELCWFALDELPAPHEVAFRRIADVLAAFREQQP
jgi:ADP-ribose pyrophosphatase YjhB (NUDIX family)